jgi:hypothetical protein
VFKNSKIDLQSEAGAGGVKTGFHKDYFALRIHKQKTKLSVEKNQKLTSRVRPVPAG